MMFFQMKKNMNQFLFQMKKRYDTIWFFFQIKKFETVFFFNWRKDMVICVFLFKWKRKKCMKMNSYRSYSTSAASPSRSPPFSEQLLLYSRPQMNLKHARDKCELVQSMHGSCPDHARNMGHAGPASGTHGKSMDSLQVPYVLRAMWLTLQPVGKQQKSCVIRNLFLRSPFMSPVWPLRCSR